MIIQQIDLHSDSESEADRGEVVANIVWKGKEYPLYDGENIIGREEDCDVILDHESVSLKHAILDMEDGIARMRDLKSKNGTSLESQAGSASYVKLGPKRRNEVVSPGSRIRFGLVDCKFITVKDGKDSLELTARPVGGNLKLDCETQFINLAPIDDEDEKEESMELYESLQSVAAAPLLPSRDHHKERAMAEQDTQIDHLLSLTSAEKAPFPGKNTPLDFVNNLASSSRTPIANGEVNIGIGFAERGRTGTGASPDLPQRTASSSEGSPLAKPLLPVTSPVETDVGDDCSTEDEGIAEGRMDDTFYAAGDAMVDTTLVLDTTMVADNTMVMDNTLILDSDGSDSDMSQDLMQAVVENDLPVGGIIQQADDTSSARDAPKTSRDEPAAALPEIGKDDKGENFNFAQENPRSASTAEENITVHPASPAAKRLLAVRSASFATSAGTASPFHELGSAYFTADTHPQDVYPDAISQAPLRLDTVPEVREDCVHDSPARECLQSSTISPIMGRAASLSPRISDSTGPSNGGVIGTTSDASRISAGHDEPLAELVARSPGAAIKDLLHQSAMPAELRVFNTQGAIAERPSTASPRVDSESCSYPPDAPLLGFDFAAASRAPLTITSSAMDITEDGRVDLSDGRVEEASLIKPRRTASVQVTKPRGKKRASDDLVQEDEDAEFEPTSTEQIKQPNARNVRARKTRSSDAGDTGEPLPVTTEVPFSQSPEKPVVTSSRRKRILDDDSEDEQEKALVLSAPVEVATKELPPDRAKKQGKGKTSNVIAAVLEEESTSTMEEKQPNTSKRGRGRATSPVESVDHAEVPPEEALSAAISESVNKAPLEKKRGRTKAVKDIEAPVAEPVDAPAMEEETSVGGKPGSKRVGGKKGLIAPDEASVATAESAATSRGGKRQTKKVTHVAEENVPVLQEEQAHTAEEPLIEAAPTKKASKKQVKASSKPSDEIKSVIEDAPAAVPAEAEEDVEEDLGVRVMFTKVDEAAYAKVLGSLPNVTIVTDASHATHVVTLPELKRTPKLMVAINCGARFIVTEQWAKDCVKAKAVVDVIQPAGAAAKKSKAGASATKHLDPRADPALFQRLLSSSYIVNDTDKEKLWNFSMAGTLAIPRSALKESSTEREQLFQGLCFFCTKGVCGETAPPADELCAIIESGGGVWLTSLEEWNSLYGGAATAAAGNATGKGKKGKIASNATDDGESSMVESQSRSLIVLTHPAVMKKEVNKKVLDALAKSGSPHSGVYSMELVFLACLRQKVDFDEAKLK